MRYLLAIWIGKILKWGLNKLGRGGTALPGLLCLKIDKDLLRKMTVGMKFGSVIITGTNGKTTTSRLLSEILDRHGYTVINNRSGSNLERGLVSVFLEEIDWHGRNQADVAVLEVDEADLKNIIKKVFCRELVITNFFRDQLDRYGDLEAVRTLVEKAIGELASSSRLVLNADDPLVASLSAKVSEGVEVVYFGLEISSQPDDYAVDVVNCVICGKKLKYEKKYIAHLGKYICPKCKINNPRSDLKIKELSMKGVEGMTLVVENEDWREWAMETKLPGMFNAYNVAAAVLAADGFELDKDLLIEAVARFKPVFGRFEKIEARGKSIYLMLSKNPTGFNQLLKTILETEARLNLVIILNDNYADGRDISWIWDVDFEKLRGRLNWLGLSGKRAEELKIRMKYAGIDMKIIGKQKNVSTLIDELLQIVSTQPILVMSTYTGMLDFRGQLQKKGLVRGFWED